MKFGDKEIQDAWKSGKVITYINGEGKHVVKSHSEMFRQEFSFLLLLDYDTFEIEEAKK